MTCQQNLYDMFTLQFKAVNRNFVTKITTCTLLGKKCTEN